jgi:hypothetical protein
MAAGAASATTSSPAAPGAGAAARPWGQVMGVPGLGALNKGGLLTAISVSCGSAGSCSVGGSYQDGSGRFQAFVANENNGKWGKAIEVRFSGLGGISCPSPGHCAAAGWYGLRADHSQGLVVAQK